MNVTGKTIAVSYHGTNYTLYNQRCREWTHPYAWAGEGTLTDSGCGVFSIANAACFLGGQIYLRGGGNVADLLPCRLQKSRIGRLPVYAGAARGVPPRMLHHDARC